MKKRISQIGPVAFWIYDLTGTFPTNYRREAGKTMGTFRGHDYQCWLGPRGKPNLMVDGNKVRLLTTGGSPRWTKSKRIAWCIVQHVEKMKEAA